MLDIKKLDDIDIYVSNEATKMQTLKQTELNAYMKGFREGAEMMYKNIRAALLNKAEK
jgi:hypothetical protein